MVQGRSQKKKRRKRKGGRSSKFHCAWEVVSVYRANRGDPENRNKISICAPTRLLKRLRQCNERRGVKFDSTERRQKGGEGSLVPNVTRSENQPSNVSYIRIYIYTRATLRSPVPGRSRHIAAARLVYTNNRAFSANKKKLPSTCPKLLRQQLSCDAWRGVKGHHRRSLFVTAIVRTEPTGDSSTMETSWKLSSSDEIRQLLPTFCSFALNFIFDLLFGGRGKRGQ